MRIVTLLTTVLLLFAPLASAGAAVPAHSSGFSAADLQRMCSSPHDTDYGFCAGYVSAIAHALLTDSVAGYRACHHEQVRSQQYVDTFTLYAKKFPAEMNADAATVVSAAIARAFPCLD